MTTLMLMTLVLVTVYVGDKIEMLVTDFFTLKKVTNINYVT